MKHKIIITESQYGALLSKLNEQSSMQFGGQKLRFGKSKLEKNEFNQSGGKYTVTIPENEWDSYIAKNENEIISIFKKNGSKVSLTNWSEIKMSDKRFAVGILEAFIKGDFTSIRITKKGETVSEPAKTDDGSKTYPSEVFSLPASVPPNSDFFVDNEWILTDVFKQMVESDIVNIITTNVDKIIQQFPQAKDRPNVYLRSLSIDTSCSTLPNGIPKSSPGADNYSKGITFVQLSTERNNAAKQYIIDRLKQLSVGIDDNTKIGQNPNGSNKGNLLGTSGPTWNSGLSKVEKNKLRPQYEQYKYAKINLDLQFNTYQPIPGPESGSTTPDKVITSVDYDVKMTKYKGGFTINIPKFSFKFGKNKGWKGTRSLACPYFG
jgi:hypothetical protein